MRALKYLCVALVVLTAGVAFAGDQSAPVKGQVPDAVLTQMGMSGMQAISDARGDTVRGKGFVAFQTSSVWNNWGHGTSTQVLVGDCCALPDLMVNGVISAGYSSGPRGATIGGTAAFNLIKF